MGAQGFPDLTIWLPRGGFTASPSNSKVGRNRATAEQIDWLDHMASIGWLAVCCTGFDAARQTIEDYLRGHDVSRLAGRGPERRLQARRRNAAGREGMAQKTDQEGAHDATGHRTEQGRGGNAYATAAGGDPDGKAADAKPVPKTTLPAVPGLVRATPL